MAGKKKAAAKKPQQKVVKELKQTHGMVEGDKVEATTLDQIWGDTGLGKYNTLDVLVYNKRLDDMGKSDLQAHAASLGLIPIDDSRMLRDRLEKEFRRHTAKYDMPTRQDSMPNEQVDPKIKKILSEGR